MDEYQYKLRYDFKQYNNAIFVLLQSLLKSSKESFLEQVNTGELLNPKVESKSLARCIVNVEEFLWYYYQNFPEKFNSILNSIIKNVTKISLLPHNKRGVFGYTNTGEKTIYFNPNIQERGELTKEERSRLWMAHELGHAVNSTWMQQAVKYSNSQIVKGKLQHDDAQSIVDGCSMLAEAMTQENAEQLAYWFAEKKRSSYIAMQIQGLFNNKPVETNFDYYGEFQMPACLFARTLGKIRKRKGNEEALKELSVMALSPNFFQQIATEYIIAGKKQEFIKIMHSMGNLKKASYANFGIGKQEDRLNSSNYLKEFNDIASKLLDGDRPIGSDDER